MKQNLGLRILGEVMEWSDERAREEFSWLRLMSRLKYDDYRDFLAGARFIENLVTWLQQFEQSEREIAYKFVRDRLVYIGRAEMQRLVENFYPEVCQRELVKTVANEMGIPAYSVWANKKAINKMEDLRRKTLFMGLSDGARIDQFRRANVGILSNEQIVVATQLDSAKWRSLLHDLKDELGKDAKFSAVYLIDDFVASGTTLIRFDDKAGRWTGKLRKFKESIESAKTALEDKLLFDENWTLYVHHYLASSHAAEVVENEYLKATTKEGESEWFSTVRFTFGAVLPDSLKVTADTDESFLKIVEQYYDPVLEDQHSEASGIKCVKLGYKACALPLILEHNTPNNSLAILWAETNGDGEDIPAMRPLFRRRQRHS